MPKVVAIYLRPARGEEPVEVSQEWLEANRKALRRDFKIEGDEPATVDLRDDGRGQLYDWAYSSSYSTGTPAITIRTSSSIGFL